MSNSYQAPSNPFGNNAYQPGQGSPSGYGMGGSGYPQRPPQQSDNVCGLLGFIFALVAFLGWFGGPIIGGALWLAGLVLSIIGMSRRPKGLATAGLIISLVGLVIGLIALIFVGAAAAWVVSNMY